MKENLDTTPAAIASAALETSLPSSVIEALQAGNKIQAIKLLREQTAMGLKEAKDIIDAFECEPAEEIFDLAPGEVPKAKKTSWRLIGLLIAICFSAYCFLKFFG